jgi:uncharacterized protein (TIGR03382 family)
MKLTTMTAAAAAGLAMTAGAGADIVEVTFQGIIDGDFGDVLPTVDTGATFTGFFRYDTNGAVFAPEGELLPGPGAAVVSYHSMLSYSVTFEENDGPPGPISFITFHADQLESDQFFETVTNDQPGFDPGVLIDNYSNRVGSAAAGGGSLAWGISLNSRDGGPFTSAALPDSLSLSDFETGFFSLDKVDDFGLPVGGISGDITTLTSRVIPTPGTGAMLALGAAAAFRRRRN